LYPGRRYVCRKAEIRVETKETDNFFSKLPIQAEAFCFYTGLLRSLAKKCRAQVLTSLSYLPITITAKKGLFVDHGISKAYTILTDVYML